VSFALRVALALQCEIQPFNRFARKNYFYPDLPKGYQISQYELPLARHGWLEIRLESGERRRIGIRRVHMEEDTGKLTHVAGNGTLVDYNRSGVPLLEIVSEPDLHAADEVYAYATRLRQLLRYLEVNSGDLEKGVLRVEPNISVRPAGSTEYGTRTEVKNQNSFRALAAATAYEIERQSALLRRGEAVPQETRGWHEGRRETFSQRSKEEAEDYRYFPEPDLPSLQIAPEWIEAERAGLPELPGARFDRYVEAYGLGIYEAGILTEERAVADWFEAVLVEGGDPQTVANWIANNLFALMNESGHQIEDVLVTPKQLAALIEMVAAEMISHNVAKDVLATMYRSGDDAAAIVEAQGLAQISNVAALAAIVDQILDENPEQVETYLQGKEQVRGWFVGQVMRATRGKANPQVANMLVTKALARRRDG
jgi:aspartyl-tRNA(Asn)/glutamyl-tRNA(Gln) amidotransferase subunit B